MTGVPVPETARPTSKRGARKASAQPAVWTDRMLTALETGVKGGVWFSLIDKVYSPINLAAAAKKVIANKGAPGVDNVTVQQYAKYQKRYLEKLGESLRLETPLEDARAPGRVPRGRPVALPL